MTIAHKIATNALLSLSLDRPSCKPLDNILLKENVHDQHRHHDQGHHRAHHAVIGSKLGADLIQKTGNRHVCGLRRKNSCVNKSLYDHRKAKIATVAKAGRQTGIMMR